ncbi:MAG TPA: EAL domain-containing protein [Polyangiaceae bacterium]|nr:EAL domain-containing protein [Polyangiaceae bacterium]
MNRPLRLLMVEDSDADADLLVRELQKGGYVVSPERVQTEASLRAALAKDEWDLIISDCAMPAFGAAAALETVRGSGHDTPFIVLSGTLDEEAAVGLLRAGANDFLTKNRIKRLVPAVDRELRDRAVRDESRASQDRIRIVDDRLHLLLEAAPDGILVAGGDGMITYVNAQIEAMFGYRREELVGRPTAVLLPERLVEPLRSHAASGLLASATASAEAPAIVTLDFDARHKHGGEFPVEARASRAATMAGDYVVSIRDVTARKRAAEDDRRLVEQVYQAQKMEAVGALAGGLAHDFNNVLSVILTYTGFLGASLAADVSFRTDVDEIRKAADRAVHLTRQLLAFGRRKPAAPAVVDLNALARGLERMLRRLVGDRIELAIVPGQTLRRVRVDSSQMEQVLMNLAINARDAMPDGGHLTIRTDNVEARQGTAPRYAEIPQGAYVEIAVSDTGVGMDPATLERIFEPFFTTKDIGKGTGLGLAVVHGVVVQAGGRVLVESALGKGTTFRVLLPATEDAGRASLRPNYAEQPRGTETVLLVEPDEQVRGAVALVLRRSGYEVVEAQSAGEALLASEQRAQPIDLLLTDVSLPRMSGRDLAERLARAQPSVRVLLMAQYGEGAQEAEDGAVSVVEKPIRPEAMLASVRALLDRPARVPHVQVSLVAGEEAPAFRVLVVGDEASPVETFARALSRAGYLTETSTGDEAERRLRHGSFDAALTAAGASDRSGLDVLRSVRATGVETPVIVIAAESTPSEASEAAGLGAFRYLSDPLPDGALLDAVGQAVRLGRLGAVRREATRLLGREEDWRSDLATLQGSFESALDKIWIAFQPVVSLRAQRVFGYEALARSDEPMLRSAGDLFGAAARLGRLSELGRTVRARIASAADAAPPDTTLFVNVHADELNDFDLWRRQAPLSRLASRVVLEITERAPLDGVRGLHTKVSKLRQLGFRIAVDDLGAGYAGLSSFARLQPDVVKLDSSLIRHLDSSSQKRSIVQSMIRLAARDLNVLLVCEGVEREEERDVLDALGADLMQGYLLGRPMHGFVAPVI